MLCFHFRSNSENWPKAQLNLRYSVTNRPKSYSKPDGEFQAALSFTYDTQLESLMGVDFCVMDLHIEKTEGEKIYFFQLFYAPKTIRSKS